MTATVTPDRRRLCTAGGEHYLIETQWQETEDSSHEITLICGPLHSEDLHGALADVTPEYTVSDRAWPEIRGEYTVLKLLEWENGAWTPAERSHS